MRRLIASLRRASGTEHHILNLGGFARGLKACHQPIAFANSALSHGGAIQTIAEALSGAGSHNHGEASDRALGATASLGVFHFLFVLIIN